MRLVWVVIPLVLIGIVGITNIDARCLPDEPCTGPPEPWIAESFAQEGMCAPYVYADLMLNVGAMFSGTVISKEPLQPYFHNVKFEIEEILIGDYKNFITITTSEARMLSSEPIGGDPFQIGEKYFVIATLSNNNTLYADASQCTSSLVILTSLGYGVEGSKNCGASVHSQCLERCSVDEFRWTGNTHCFQMCYAENANLCVPHPDLRQNISPKQVPFLSSSFDIIPIQNSNSEGVSIESVMFFKTLYFAKLISVINQSIQSLSDDVFFDSTNKADFQEILVTGDDNIYDLFSKSNVFYFDPKENINNFYEATTKLSELKTRMDSSINGNSDDDWIVDQKSQNQILEIIDYALDEYLQSVGGNLNPVSIDDLDENWWSTIRMYQENAEGHTAYLCYSESLKRPPNNELTQIHFEIPECQTFIPKSLSLITQLRIGVPAEKIQCDEGLKLIFKSADNSPACVKPTTAEKLIERGWARV